MTWSFSRLNLFDDCPYRWFLTYLYRDENGKRVKKKNGFFAEYGSYMHLILQMFFSKILRKDELSTFYVLHFSDNILTKAPSRKIYNNYFKSGFDYFEQFDYPKRRIIGIEREIDFTFADKRWTGFLDLESMTDDGKLIITDHKSRSLKPRSKRHKPTKTDLELDDYLKQLYIYSAAVKERDGKYPDVLEFNCFRTSTIIQEPFDINRLAETEAWAKESIEKITCNKSWEAKPDFWRCRYLCDVSHECEYYAMMMGGE